MTRPKTSWEWKVGVDGPSPLAGIAEKDPPIVITKAARKAAEKHLAKAIAPYRNGVARRRDPRTG